MQIISCQDRNESNIHKNKVFDEMHYQLPEASGQELRDVYHEIDSSEFNRYAWMWIGLALSAG